jgi:hypothetical protein
MYETVEVARCEISIGFLSARICELRSLRKELAGLIADCDANTQDAKCPVIERLAS